MHLSNSYVTLAHVQGMRETVTVGCQFCYRQMQTILLGAVAGLGVPYA